MLPPPPPGGGASARSRTDARDAEPDPLRPPAAHGAWSHHDPVTMLGARWAASGWDQVSEAFRWLASHFSNGEFHLEVIAADLSGDLAYTVGHERARASFDSGPVDPIRLRVTTSTVGRTASGKSSTATPTRWRPTKSRQRPNSHRCPASPAWLCQCCCLVFAGRATDP